MNEHQIRALFENRFGSPPEAFGLSPVETDNGVQLTNGKNSLSLAVVNGQQAGWHLNGKIHCETPPAKAVLKPTDPDRHANGEALRAVLG